MSIGSREAGYGLCWQILILNSVYKQYTLYGRHQALIGPKSTSPLFPCAAAMLCQLHNLWRKICGM